MYPGTVEHRSRPRARCLIVPMSPGNFAHEFSRFSSSIRPKVDSMAPSRLRSVRRIGQSGSLSGVHTSFLTQLCAFGLLIRAIWTRLRDGSVLQKRRRIDDARFGALLGRRSSGTGLRPEWNFPSYGDGGHRATKSRSFASRPKSETRFPNRWHRNVSTKHHPRSPGGAMPPGTVTSDRNR